MIHFKLHNAGFSLIEVLLALSIASAVLVPVFILQGRVLKTINYYSTALQATIFMESFFNEQRLEAAVDKSNSQVTAEKQLEDPELKLTYTRKKVPGGSALNKLDDIYLEQTTAQWTDLRGKQEEQLISFIFKPEKKRS